MTATQSYVTYISNGVVTDFTFSFPYLEREHILVLLDEVETTSFTFASSGTVRLNTAPANGVEIIIRRQTPKNSALLEIQTKSTLKSSELNAQILQTLYASQEAVDTSELIRAGGLTIPSVESAKVAAEEAKDLAIIAQGLAEAARDTSVGVANGLTNTVANAEAATLAATLAATNAQTIADNFGNVDNTSDLDKPVSTAQANALADKASLAQLAEKLNNAGGTLTGNLTAPALISSASKSDTPMSNPFLRDLNSWFGMRQSVANDLCVDVNNSGSAVNALKITQDGYVLKPNNPAFSAYRSTAFTKTAGLGALIPQDLVSFNVGLSYDPITGRFTAPVAGIYGFAVNVTSVNGSAAQTYFTAELRVNGGRLAVGGWNNKASGYYAEKSTFTVNLAQGDYVEPACENSNTVNLNGGSSIYPTFSGFLIG